MKKQQAQKTWIGYAAKDYGPKTMIAANDLENHCQQNYFKPSQKDFELTREKRLSFLAQGRAVLVVPMKERGPVIASLMDHAASQMPAGNICVVNDNSDSVAVKTANSYGVRVVNKNKVLDILKWGKLLPLLNLSQRPRGKGVAIWAGYLFEYLLARKNGFCAQWLFQSDAEISTCDIFKPVDHLCLAALKAKPQILHLKMAKAGRNNEGTMAARNALMALKHFSSLYPSREAKTISQRAQDLFLKLMPLKWIMSGIFGLRWETAMQRPFSSGIVDEEVIAPFVEDLSGGGATFQVANPYPCGDGVNDFLKEEVSVQLSANFIVLLALIAKPVPQWTLSDIALFNKKLLSFPVPMAFIPPEGDEGPVKPVVLPSNEKILPSITMLEKHGLIDWKKADRLFEV